MEDRKTPEYVRRAQKEYMKDKKRVTVILTEEQYCEIVRAAGEETPGAFIKRAALAAAENDDDWEKEWERLISK